MTATMEVDSMQILWRCTLYSAQYSVIDECLRLEVFASCDRRSVLRCVNCFSVHSRVGFPVCSTYFCGLFLCNLIASVIQNTQYTLHTAMLVFLPCFFKLLVFDSNLLFHKQLLTKRNSKCVIISITKTTLITQLRRSRSAMTYRNISFLLLSLWHSWI